MSFCAHRIKSCYSNNSFALSIDFMRISFKNAFLGYRSSVAESSPGFWQSYFLDNGSLIAFFLLPFLAAIISPFAFLGFDRFAFQWHVLLISFLVMSACVITRKEFLAFVAHLLRVRLIAIALALFSAWLFAMAIVHGIGDQFESISSAVLFVFMLPICFFAVHQSDLKKSITDNSLALLLILVLLENSFLMFYMLNGFGMSQVYMNVMGPPRLFLNVRDGNFLSLVQFQLIAFSSLCGLFDCSLKKLPRKYSILLLGFASFQPFFNAWITQGRALLLCLGFAVLMLLLFGRLQRNTQLIDAGVISSVSAGLAFVVYQISQLFISSQSLPPDLVSLVERSDGGRFELWRLWIESGLSHSLWFGHGLGHLVENSGAQRTPHNLLVQLFADAGFSGVFIFLALTLILVLCCLRASAHRAFLIVFSSLPVAVYLLLGNPLFWPVGVYAMAILFIACSSGCIDFHYSLKASTFVLKDSVQLIFSAITFCIACVCVTGLSSVKFL